MIEFVDFKVKEGEREKLKKEAYEHGFNVSQYLRWLIEKERRRSQKEEIVSIHPIDYGKHR